MSAPLATIVILVRYPRPGEVKRRIAAALGDDVAVDVHDRLARHAVGVALELKRSHDAHVEVRCDAAFAGAAREWLGAGPRYRYLGDGDVEERMVLAFSRTFAGAKSKVIVMGADCAALTATHLRAALARLDEADCVIGPSTGGGYYLLGLSPDARARAVPALFTDIPWGTPEVLVQTLHTAGNKGLTVALLDELTIVDAPQDVEAAERILADVHPVSPSVSAPRGWRRWLGGRG